MNNWNYVRYLVGIQSVAYLLVAIFFSLLLLASGHQVNFKDFVQLRLILEIFFFFLGAYFLVLKRLRNTKSNLIVLLLIIINQASMIDLWLEISPVQYGSDERPSVILFALFAMMFINNIFLCYNEIRILVANTRSSP